MTNNIRFLFVLLLLELTLSRLLQAQQVFTIDLKDRKSDLFKVTLLPEKLSKENDIYQFASTAPGTYQQMDIGRFVKTFAAYDQEGKELKSERISINQWKLIEPEKIKKIFYTVEDTWDTPVDSNQIYPMGGSNIEDDNVLINGQCVFGYFKNLQSEPIKIKLEYPNEWTAGTALEKDSEGFYNAENYDKIVDSPILLGRLSQASEKVNGTEIDVYTYSKSGEISSGELLSSLKDILSAEEKFLKGLPVKRYAFLFHFQNLTYGAWEHSYSSEYVFREQPLTEDFQKFIRTIVSHEFFHIFTPLNLHSQLVEKFNFERPVMSKHLWLYEGVTEWAANIIELRDSLISLDEYLQRVKEKLTLNDMFDKSLSLTDLAVNSYKLQGQYVNIYQRGAVVAGLLDILLLDLSKGRRGLREVLLDLSKKYGSEKSFDENSFFEEFEKETYPEVGEFFNKYVKGTEKLPVKEYYNKIGIEYNESAGYDTSDIRLGVQLGVLDNKIAVFDLSEDAVSAGLQKGDIVIMVQGDTLSLQNAQQKFYAIKNSSKIGDEVSLTVLRKNSQKEIKLKLAASLIKHQFRIIQNPDTDQLKLRELWLRNL